MKQTNVPYCEKLDFSVCAEVIVDVFKWKVNDYTPKTTFRLCWNPEALAVEAVASEVDLRMETDKDGGDVWHDSCMEFFFGPEEQAHRYINLEVNPKGVIVMGFGAGRDQRRGLESSYKTCLKIKAEINKEKGYWSVRYIIPFSMLKEIFGSESEKDGFRELRGNFYKCGEKSQFPHYGMWSEVDRSEPDFHRPEYFGKLTLMD